MLQFEHLFLTKQNHPILQDVTFSLPSHTLSVLVGKNGSGKSSLISCISGENRYKGSISLTGKSLEKMKGKERAKKISLLPQTLAKVHLTVEQVVAFGRLPYGALGYRFTEEDRKMIDRALRQVEMEEMRHRFVDTLSGGEKQKVYLAMMLAQDAEWMIFDEPTTFMDAAAADRFMKLLCHVQQTEQKSVLVVLHDLAAAVRYASLITVLQEGRVAFSGKTEDCLSQNVLQDIFSVRTVLAEDHIFFVPK